MLNYEGSTNMGDKVSSVEDASDALTLKKIVRKNNFTELWPMQDTFESKLLRGVIYNDWKYKVSHSNSIVL